MKSAALLGAAVLATGVACAQGRHHRHRIRIVQAPMVYEYGAWPRRDCPPRIIYVGGNYAPRNDAYVPFAYGSFFYGQSIRDWMRARQRGFRW